jgi:hypothetical protein
MRIRLGKTTQRLGKLSGQTLTRTKVIYSGTKVVSKAKSRCPTCVRVVA